MTNGHRATLVSLSFSLPQLSSAQTPKTPSPKHTRLKRQSMTSLQAEEPEQALVSSLANASLIESAEFTFATADGDRLTVNRSTLALHAPIIRSMFEDAHDTGDIITLQGTTRAWRAVLDIINTPFDMPLPSTGVLQEALLIVSTFEMVLVKSHILLLTL